MELIATGAHWVEECLIQEAGAGYFATLLPIKFCSCVWWYPILPTHTETSYAKQPLILEGTDES